ncbi:hypothetical protein NDU88_005399 [Pleurodeles waltl]|uniref:Uncharacterized protein n=1 Tax=Pleurodeles waltl TaxID=8319 RepID=A0AAV7SLL0_PLEWA|nr:hypothetical protein NDU88_005399 [Pleurodeles waltl]
MTALGRAVGRLIYEARSATWEQVTRRRRLGEFPLHVSGPHRGPGGTQGCTNVISTGSESGRKGPDRLSSSFPSAKVRGTCSDPKEENLASQRPGGPFAKKEARGAQKRKEARGRAVEDHTRVSCRLRYPRGARPSGSKRSGGGDRRRFPPCVWTTQMARRDPGTHR